MENMTENYLKLSVITSCYKGEPYLKSFISQLKQQSYFPVLKWILIHNEPSIHEMEVVNDFAKEFPEKIRHIIRTSVEPLSASWNLGWKIAETEYICFWNLDDCRPRDSLERQVKTLEHNPDCVMSYGDFLEVPQYGSMTGITKKTTTYNSFIFQRRFPGGAFMVWRRNASDRVGYFDEQLRISCDYDFVTRAVVAGLKMCKTSGLVGYFTNSSNGLSTIKGTNNEVIERIVVQLRYGMFDKAGSENVVGMEKYRISEIFIENNWFPVQNFVKSYESFINRRYFLKKFAFARRLFMKLLKG